MSGAGTPVEYPPAEHLLRDLRLTVEHRPDGTSTAWMPVGEHVRHRSGAPRAGVLSTLVDVVGGGLAAVAARPDWIATADLTLHLTPRPVAGEVQAHGRVLRQGRTTVVIEVGLRDAAGPSLGLATMSFAVLPRRAENLVVDQVDQVSRMTMATPDSGLDAPFPERIRVSVIDAAAGTVELPLRDYIRNSLGAVQGGVMAAAADAAAEQALGHACGTPVETVDLQITYLALAKAGPIRTRTRVLTAEPEFGAAHVEIVDTGAGDRLTMLARVVAREPGVTHFSDAETGRAVNRTTRVSIREVMTDETTPAAVDGEVVELEHLRGPSGSVRVGALLTMADTVGGMCSGLAVLPRWVVSTNLMLRTVPAVHRGPFALSARALRIGRSSVVTQVEIRERDGDRAVVADGVLTSAVLEPEGGPPEFARPLVLDAPDGPDAGLPLLEFFGIAPAGPATVVLDITDRVRNPWGILHGGATAVLVDAAATRAVGDAATAVDVVLHFLRPGRVGPAIARATVLGRRPDGHLVRVEVVDAGAGDRVMAVAVCTVREP